MRLVLALVLVLLVLTPYPFASGQGCPPGYMGHGNRYEQSSAGGDSDCQPCGAGSYQPDEDQDVCLPCAAGYYSYPASPLCSSCPPGSYSANGASQCSACPPNTYSSGYASSSCAACSQLTVSAGSSASCSFDFSASRSSRWVASITLPQARACRSSMVTYRRHSSHW